MDLEGGPLDGALARKAIDSDEMLGVMDVFGCDGDITLGHKTSQ
jgi:hypothetical protein